MVVVQSHTCTKCLYHFRHILAHYSEMFSLVIEFTFRNVFCMFFQIAFNIIIYFFLVFQIIWFKIFRLSNASLPLRGFLICPECGKILTGSASKGMTQYYSYYHCTTGCKCRLRADNANEKFIAELRKYIPKPEVAELFKEVIAEAWEEQTTHHHDDSKQLRLQIKELEGKLSYIRDLLSSKQIEPGDFREMKAEYSNKLEKLEAKLSATKYDEINIKSLLDKGVNNLLKLDHLYEISDVEKKREIISSIYPEKLTFDGNAFRTIRINEAIRLIYSIGEGSSENKKRTNRNKSNLSCQVG
jgi:site-specific DNA recombinase